MGSPSRKQVGPISQEYLDTMTEHPNCFTVLDVPPQQEAKSDDESNKDDVVIIAGDGAHDIKEEYGFACHSIHDLICENNIFSALCTLMYETVPELGDALSADEWTFFAPTDSAFEAIEDELKEMSDDELLRLFKFHAHEGSTIFPWNLDCTEKIEMASGDMSRTRCETNKDTGAVDKYQKGNGNYNLGLLPKIEFPSLRACNGIVHVIDAVMIPVGGK